MEVSTFIFCIQFVHRCSRVVGDRKDTVADTHWSFMGHRERENGTEFHFLNIDTVAHNASPCLNSLNRTTEIV